MKQKLYALDAFFIEKLKLSENDPYTLHYYNLGWNLWTEIAMSWRHCQETACSGMDSDNNPDCWYFDQEFILNKISSFIEMC